jgi:hypothetical protein
LIILLVAAGRVPVELAIGRSVDIAINHDENAVAMHTTNHPGTLHYCESVFDVNPRLLPQVCQWVWHGLARIVGISPKPKAVPR